jgi:hypothetical protein
MEFGVLVEHCVDSPKLKEAIKHLIERKEKGHELDRERRIDVISDFVESELERLETRMIEAKRRSNTKKLNELFRKALNELD